MPPREELTIRSGDDDLAAWWYPAEAPPGRDPAVPAPCVVLAHGFSLTRRDGLAVYAEAFAAAGLHALVFDYRYLGDSGGTPRQRFRTGAQRADWRRVVDYARERRDVDPDQIVVWGYSFSGGHLAALLSGPDAPAGVTAAIVLCPFVDGLARVRSTRPSLIAWIVPRAVLDVLGRHRTIPATGPPGSHAAMALPGEADGFAATAQPGSGWVNAISPGVFLTVALIRPVRRASRIGVPLWVGRCTEDITVDARAVRRLAERAPQGELHDFPGDHFRPFVGDGAATVIDEQVAFLRRTLPATAGQRGGRRDR